MRFYLPIILFVVFGYQQVFAQNVSQKSLVSTSLTAPANHGDFVLLSIDKKTMTASLQTLVKAGEPIKVIKKLKVAIGRNDGDKQIKGDLKTPEGIYFTETLIDGRGLPEKYGPLAITMNYPNPVDRSESKTGSGIWLHGVGKFRAVADKNITEGCVAFEDDQITWLANWMRPNSSIVVISDDAQGSQDRLTNIKVHNATVAWIKAWNARDMDGYINSYADNFQSSKGSKNQYKRYKSAVFNSYKVMKANMNHLRIASHKKYAISVMKQHFIGDRRINSIGVKILYWKPDTTGAWKIFREDFRKGSWEPSNKVALAH